MSLSSILNTAGAALKTYQSALSVTGQNIANADNPLYSIQNAEYTTTTPVSTDGQIYGTGVTVASITQEINQLLENQLTTQMSVQAALEEKLVYMSQVEDLFAEGTDDSLNTLLDNYWSAWESLGNTPAVDTEQEQVYETGLALAHRLNAIDSTLKGLLSDLDQEIAGGVGDINALTTEIAALNKSILSTESSGANANDLNDRRNALVDDLGALIDIDITIKKDGSYLITTTGGLPLVEDQISHSLKVADDRVCWCGNSGNDYDITDDISGGAMGGWLIMRDEVIPEISAELDELTTAVIWTMNYQHSQGAGQTYFQGPLEGTYATDGSGTLASLFYASNIDYSKDFSMVIQDDASAASRFQTVLVNMGISRAQITDIQGSGRADATYALTVVDEGVLGEQTVVQSGGDALGGISSSASGSVSDALDAALGEQTLTITTPDGTQQLLISDSGSGAARSAADIAAELSSIDGITAHASATGAQFSLGGITQAQNGDIVKFTLYVDGQEEAVSFTVDGSQGSLEEQFETALASAAQEINQAQQNTDLMVDGTTLQSASGVTIGIQDFEVIDNAGVALGNFQNFDTGDSLTLTLATDGSPPDAMTVTIDLMDVDTSDSALVAQAFYDAINDQLSMPFTAEMDEATGQLILRTTDGTGISISGVGDTGNDASVAVTVLGGSTSSGDGQLDFDNLDIEGATANTTTDDFLVFALPGCKDSAIRSAATNVGEAGGTYDTAAVLTGSVTILMDPDLKITSDDTTSTGLFGTTGTAGDGNSMITLGGTGGYTNFDDGDNISFEVDGYAVSYTITDPGTGLTDAEQAQQLYAALTAALPPEGYQVIQNGTSISIVRTAEGDDPLTVSEFTDNTGQNATLAVSTGTGTGAEAPENELLVSGDDLNNSATAQTWGDPAVVYWEIFDSNGEPTGESGYVEIDEPGTVEITDNNGTALTFEVSQGSLVAGNTLRINTDDQGIPDPLEVEVTGTANCIDDTYEFTVISGGSVPDNGEPVVIEWSSGTASGTVEVAGSDAGDVPVSVVVDGMTLQFNSGTLVEGDVFYVTTDTTGEPLNTDDNGVGAVDTLSDWHWTINSFADEFNRSAGGVTATVSDDNTLVFDTNKDYCAVDNIRFSDADGISETNTSITVLNYTALETAAEELQLVRTDGIWTIANDPTGGSMQIIPQGGDDDGFMVDLDGDGLGDIQIHFDQAVSGDGAIQMDLAPTDSSDYSFVFAGDEDGDSGLAAALGLNTYFTGVDAGTIGVNQVLADGDYLASGMVDSATGELASGDSTNAMAMADTRYEKLSLKNWNYTRGEAPTASLSETCLDDYEATLISAIGYTSSSVQTSLDYSELMVYQLTKQRDSFSAVSLDEEMIKLTAQQAAYAAAAKLLTVVDEMFQTLLAVR